jgi:multidrug efflux pump subunit AcrB
MKIAEQSVDYPRLVILGSIVLLGAGVVGIFALPIERTPRVQIPVINVVVPNVGMGPEAIEAEITREIEEMAGTLDHLDYYVSMSVNGASMVNFTFLDHVNVKEAKRDVQNLIDQVRPKFPRDAKEPSVNDVSFSDFPIIRLLVSGKGDMRSLRAVADRLQDRIEGLPGVSSAEVYGGHEREVQVQLNPHLLNLYGITYDEVSRAVATANAEAPTGSIDFESGRELRVRFRGKYQDLTAIEYTPLATREGQTILLRDVSDVVDHYKRINRYTDTWTGQAVSVQVSSKTDINTLETIDTIYEIIDEEQARVGDAYRITAVNDDGRGIAIMLNQIGASALYGFCLVLVILTIAMGFRNGLIVAFAMPFSLVVAAGLMLAVKMTIDDTIAINNMVMFSVILVIGMVVDGALIVGENIYRHIEEGKPNIEAAKIGIREVGPAVIAADLTTISAFVPMLLVSGVMGQFFGVMPITVSFALMASVLVDHFVLPLLGRYGMKTRRAIWVQQDEGKLKKQMYTHLDPADDHRPVHASYMRTMAYCLHHRWVVLAGTMGGICMAASLFFFGAIGFRFMPDSDVPFLEVDFELPLGTGVDRTREVGKSLMATVLDLKDRGELFGDPLVVVGSSGGGGFHGDSRSRSGPEFGSIGIELVAPDERERTSHEIERALRDGFPNLPDVHVEVRRAKEGPPMGANISIRVKGTSETTLDELGQIAEGIADILREIPGTIDVSTDYQLRPETLVEPKPQIAALFGVTNEMIVRSTQFALNGVEVTEVDFGGQEDIDLRILNKNQYRNEVKDLKELPIRTPEGRHVTLDQVADVKQRMGLNQIRHRDQDRVLRVLADVDDDVALVDDVFDQLDAKLAEVRKKGDPVLGGTNYTIVKGGENEERDRSMRELTQAMGVGAALILVILVAQFNSFSQPLIVMLSIPLGLIGVVYGLMVCGFDFSISSMIGVVALTGIVVNDAIVLVDFINRLRAEGMSLEAAVIRGGQLRLRPIFLTTITTIGGLLPMAIGGGTVEFFRPLSVAIMFGLAFATVLTLVIIPTAYYTQARWAEKWQNRSRHQPIDPVPATA